MSVVRLEPSEIVAGKATPTGLDLPDGLEFEEWLDIGRPLLTHYVSMQWAIGDWLNYGERHYGHLEAEAARLHRDPGTLANISSTSAAIPPERRRPTLTWSHHRAVVALSPEEQDAVLDLAERDGLRVREVDLLVRQRRGGGSPRQREAAVDDVVVRLLEVKVPAAGAERASAVLTAVADQLRDELADVGATVEVR